MRVGQKVWLALVGAGALAACSASTQNAPRPEPKHKDEIMQMWKEIRHWRKQAGMDRLEPQPWQIKYWDGKTVAAARAICTKDREPKTPDCADLCSIADNICNNAEDICRIADGPLRGDPWAKDKCDSAKASCSAAKKKCCGCNNKRSSESVFIEPSAEDD